MAETAAWLEDDMDYAVLAQTAKRLIEANGRPLIIRKVANETAVLDSNQPWRGNDASDPPASGGPVEVEVTGVLVNYQDTNETSDTVKRATKKALVAQQSALDTNGVAIDLTDYTVLVDGEEIWKVVRVDPLTPGDRCLLYQFFLRQ